MPAKQPPTHTHTHNTMQASGAHIRVFGHKVPDTDAICCALARAWDLRQQGLAAIAYRLGEPNKETE